VLGHFDKKGCCAVVIVAQRRFVVQERFVVIAKALLWLAFGVRDISECVVESTGAKKGERSMLGLHFERVHVHE